MAKYDEFSNRLNSINKDEIKDFLLSQNEPCFESSIYKIAFPETQIRKTNTLTLYQNHFLLFHILYKMQDDFYKKGKYLHVHCMRTIVIDYPSSNKCIFFDENFGKFCEVECTEKSDYCEFHLKKTGDKNLEELSLKYFYMDIDNYFRLDENTADAFISGTWEILRHYDDYIKSFEVLDISETSDISLIKKKFRYLAKIHHPDHGAGSSEKFNEINNAYRLLMKILPRLSFPN